MRASMGNTATGVVIGLCGVTAVLLGGTEQANKPAAYSYGRPIIKKEFAKARPGDAHVGKNFPVVPLAPREPKAVDLSLRVKPNNTPMADAQIPAINKTVAKQLNDARLGTNRHREKHFKWITEDPEITTHAWHGYVLSVDKIPGGVLVTLRICPSISRGQSATTFDYSIEKYSIVGGKVSFQGGIDPPDSSPGISILD